MSRTDQRPSGNHPRHGEIGYLQIPAIDIARSAAFYEAVFGWSVDLTYGSFEAPGVIGQWIPERSPTPTAGPVVWLCVDGLWPTLHHIEQQGGTVLAPPQLDQGERWLAEINDPAGNRIGLVAPVRTPQQQTLIAVRDVEASSRWYQELLGLKSDHGGPHYERLLSGGTLVLQLHSWDTEHDHGRIGEPDREVGNGVVVWFGEVSDFDDVVTRAEQLGVSVVIPPHRNPAPGDGNGPGHREIWIKDPDGYTIVVASPDGQAHEPS